MKEKEFARGGGGGGVMKKETPRGYLKKGGLLAKTKDSRRSTKNFPLYS